MAAGRGDEQIDTSRSPSQEGLPNWRIVATRTISVVLVFGSRDDVNTLREEIAEVLAPLGLWPPEPRPVSHMSEGSTSFWVPHPVETPRGTYNVVRLRFIADRPIRLLKDKIRALTS